MHLVGVRLKRFLIILTSCLMFVNIAYAGKTIAKGVATIFHSEASARNQALRQALRTAVEQGVGLVLESKTLMENYQVINDTIYSSATGYIENHRIIKEEKIGNEIHITIEAEVSQEKIKGKLGALRILHKRMGNKRFVVLYHQTSKTLPKDHIAVSKTISAIQSEMIKNGFRVFNQKSIFHALEQTKPMGNGDRIDDDWIRLAKSNLIDMIIEFELYAFKKGGTSDPTFKFNAAMIDIEIKAYDIASGRLLGAGIPRVSQGKKLTNARENSPAWENEQAEAAMSAAQMATMEMVEDIATYYQSVGDMGNSFLMTFVGFNSDRVSDLLNILETLEGYQELNELEEKENFSKIEYFTSLKGRRLKTAFQAAAAKEGIKFNREIKNREWIISPP